jgi:hypothetical protein
MTHVKGLIPPSSNFLKGPSSQQSDEQPGHQGTIHGTGVDGQSARAAAETGTGPIPRSDIGRLEWGAWASMWPILCQRQTPTNMFKLQGMGDPMVLHVRMMIGPPFEDSPAHSNLLNSPAIRGGFRALG